MERLIKIPKSKAQSVNSANLMGQNLLSITSAEVRNVVYLEEQTVRADN